MPDFGHTCNFSCNRGNIMPAFTVVLIGFASAALPLPDGVRLLHYVRPPADLIARLTDDHADLIVVDGAADDWQAWTSAPKRSPATRRIPLVLVSADAERRAAAHSAGADRVLLPDALAAQLPDLLRDLVQAPAVALQAQLECDCAAELPPLALTALEKFNAGEYYAQHDLLESLWMQTESPVRDLYRAILQVGVAYYQIKRGNRRGALKMLLRGQHWLARLPDVCQGVDVRGLRDDAAQVRAALERLPTDDLSAFDRTLLRPVRWG